MLTVIHSPTKYDFSRNPNYVEISTDNLTFNVNTGSIAIIYFTGLATAALNDQLNIQFGGTLINYVFKAATNLSASPKEIARNTSGLSAQNYISDLANTLFADLALSNFIDIIPYQSSLFFKAKQPGTAYDLQYSNTNVVGANLNVSLPTDNIVPVNRPNYKIYLELQVYETSTWKSIIKIGKEPSNNKVRFDLSDYINAYLKYDFPDFSNFGSSEPCPQSCKKFRVKISESYGEPAVEVSTGLTGMTTSGLDGFKHVSTEYKVLKAGFDKTSSKLVRDNQFVYYDVLDGLFLTRQPRVKKISRKSNEWLYYLFKAAPASNVCIKKTIYKKDGTTIISLEEHTDPGIQIEDVWRFSVHYDGQYSYNPDYVKMEVFVMDVTTNTRISEIFTFVFDDEYRKQETFLYFMNSDSGCDTIRLFGLSEFSIDIIDESFDRTPTITDTDYDGDIEQNFSEKNNSFTVFSGWINAEQMLYVEELWMSKKLFTYGNIYGQPVVIPLIRLSKKFIPHKTDENLKGYIFQFKEAVNSEISQAQFIPIL